MDVFITRRGGGGKLFAAIGVIYTAGAICTCTNGSKTMTAKNTSGQWVFSIPETGTWTVIITDGGQSVSQDTEITAEGQFVAVELRFEKTLYENGAFTEIGGMSALSPGRITVSDVIRCEPGGNYYGTFFTNVPISADNLATISLEITAGQSWCDPVYHNYYPDINICSTKPTKITNQTTGQHDGTVVASASIAFTPFANNASLVTIDPQTVKIDVSAVTGDVYIVPRVSGAASLNGFIEISKITVNFG